MVLLGALGLVVGLAGWQFRSATDGPSEVADPGRNGSSGLSAQPAGAKEFTSILPPPDGADVVEIPVDALAGQPAFAALADHQLFVADAIGLHRIDIDTGDIDEFRRSVLPGALVGRYRDQLILIEEQRRVLAVPAADPASDPLLLLDLAGSDKPWSIQQARMVDDHRLVLHLWTFTEPFVDTAGRLIVDLDTRTVTQQVTGVGIDLMWADDLTWVAGGGLFEVAADGYRHLADGIPVVAGRRFVLVYGCDDHNDCDRRWIDRQSGGWVERPVPDAKFWQLEFVGRGDRVLFVNGDEGQRYFDAVHGWLLPENIIRGSGGDYFDHPVEDVVDGRILLAPTVDGIVAYDLDTHAARRLDLGGIEVRGVTSILAVPKIHLRERAS